MEAILIACRDMLQFDGRTRVRNFLYFQIVTVAIAITIFALEDGSRIVNGEFDFGLGMTGFLLLLFLPNLAITFRRLHDADFSGWWFLVTFIPFVGPFVLLVLCLSSGSVGANRFGPCPRGIKGAETEWS